MRWVGDDDCAGRLAELVGARRRAGLADGERRRSAFKRPPTPPVARRSTASTATSARALLVFDCNARLLFLGDGVVDEVDRIVAHADGAAIAGLYTYGEIARTRGSAGFHQQTLVVLAIA